MSKKRVMKLSLDGAIELICGEAIVTRPYKDSVGVWTIGVGHTAAAGGLDPRTFKGELSVPQVLELFWKTVQRYVDDVNRALKVSVTQYEFDALVDFHYNTGAIAKAALTKSINAGDKKRAAQQFMNYKRPPEIIERRKRSMHLFQTGQYLQRFALLLGVTPKGYPDWARGRRVDVRALLTQHNAKPVTELVREVPKAVVSNPNYITQGARGELVREWQHTLIALGYDVGSAGADGDFGRATFAATQAFQRDQGLRLIDGRVGTATREAAATALAAAKPAAPPVNVDPDPYHEDERSETPVTETPVAESVEPAAPDAPDMQLDQPAEPTPPAPPTYTIIEDEGVPVVRDPGEPVRTNPNSGSTKKPNEGLKTAGWGALIVIVLTGALALLGG